MRQHTESAAIQQRFTSEQQEQLQTPSLTQVSCGQINTQPFPTYRLDFSLRETEQSREKPVETEIWDLPTKISIVCFPYVTTSNQLCYVSLK